MIESENYCGSSMVLVILPTKDVFRSTHDKFAPTGPWVGGIKKTELKNLMKLMRRVSIILDDRAHQPILIEFSMRVLLRSPPKTSPTSSATRRPYGAVPESLGACAAPPNALPERTSRSGVVFSHVPDARASKFG